MSYIFFDMHVEYTFASVRVHSVQTAQYKNAANSAFGFSSVLRCEEIYFKRLIGGSKYRYESDFSLQCDSWSFNA